MCRVEILDNMETTKTEFQNPCIFIIQRKNIINILVSKNKACGLKLFWVCVISSPLTAGSSWQITFTLRLCILNAYPEIKVRTIFKYLKSV